jgi:hypothetical protein
LFLFLAARKRSEATMRFNHFDSTIFGITITGQGSTNAVEGTHRSTLRNRVIAFARRLALRLASWRALKRMPVAMLASMTPVMAVCPSYSVIRQSRDQRVGVVETRGTVGVC